MSYSKFNYFISFYFIYLSEYALIGNYKMLMIPFIWATFMILLNKSLNFLDWGWFLISTFLHQSNQKIGFAFWIVTISMMIMLVTLIIISHISTTLVIRSVKTFENLEDVDKDPKMKTMIFSNSGVSVHSNDIHGNNEIIKRNSYRKAHRNDELDNDIGLFELSDQKYKASFMNGELAVIGERFLLKLMAKLTCKSGNFKYYISDKSLLHMQSSFAFSPCSNPDVRRIFNKRAYILTDYGMAKNLIKSGLNKMTPSLINTDLSKCSTDSVKESIVLGIADYRILLDTFGVISLIACISISYEIYLYADSIYNY